MKNNSRPLVVGIIGAALASVFNLKIDQPTYWILLIIWVFAATNVLRDLQNKNK